MNYYEITFYNITFPEGEEKFNYSRLCAAVQKTNGNSFLDENPLIQFAADNGNTIFNLKNLTLKILINEMVTEICVEDDMEKKDSLRITITQLYDLQTANDVYVRIQRVTEDYEIPDKAPKSEKVLLNKTLLDMPNMFNDMETNKEILENCSSVPGFLEYMEGQTEKALENFSDGSMVC